MPGTCLVEVMLGLVAKSVRNVYLLCFEWKTATLVLVAAGSDQHGALAFVKDAMHISKAFSIVHESSLSFGNT